MLEGKEYIEWHMSNPREYEKSETSVTPVTGLQSGRRSRLRVLEVTLLVTFVVLHLVTVFDNESGLAFSNLHGK